MKARDADAYLDPTQFGLLNSEFYSAHPASYLRTRMRLLYLTGGATRQLEELLVDGVPYEGLIAKIDADDPDGADSEQLQSYLITETEVLLHHASEVLLRLYLAHRELPDCPWLEVLRLQDWSKFQRQLDELSSLKGTPEQQAALTSTFLGGPCEGSEEVVEAIERLLLMLAERLNKRANMYNSIKHGLTVVAGQSSIAVSLEGSQGGFHAGGPSVAFLEVKPDRSGRPRWYRTTEWVSIKRNLWLLDMVLTELDSLWLVAKARYTGEAPDGVQAITKEHLKIYHGELAEGGPAVRQASFTLAYLESKRRGT